MTVGQLNGMHARGGWYYVHRNSDLRDKARANELGTLCLSLEQYAWVWNNMLEFGTICLRLEQFLLTNQILPRGISTDFNSYASFGRKERLTAITGHHIIFSICSSSHRLASEAALPTVFSGSSILGVLWLLLPVKEFGQKIDIPKWYAVHNIHKDTTMDSKS